MIESDEQEYPYVDEHEYNCDYISKRGSNGNQVTEDKPE